MLTVSILCAHSLVYTALTMIFAYMLLWAIDLLTR